MERKKVEYKAREAVVKKDGKIKGKKGMEVRNK
jgi:hypothetical protein